MDPQPSHDRRNVPRPERRAWFWFYPITITYLCVMVTVVVVLLAMTEPIGK